MFGFLKKNKGPGSLFGNTGLSREEAAALLGTNEEALEAFENSYRRHVATRGVSDNLFQVNAKEMAEMMPRDDAMLAPSSGIRERIVKELLNQTEVLSWDGERFIIEQFNNDVEPVAKEEIEALPKEMRPQLSGSLMSRDMGSEPSYPMLLMMYKRWLTEKDPKKKKTAYDIFRQGLDILDVDEVTYQIIGTNPCSIGNWLPPIATAAREHGFFKVPKTRVIKLPLPVLQLAHMEYQWLTPATLAVVDEYCRQAFSLDESKDYFVKTGTYSSKFDFRNARVNGSEIKELGQYLLFIHYQALCHAHYDLSGRNQPVTYGMSTTNEWAVREFIKSDSKLEIYHGLPLRTEYRLFVDFDSGCVIGKSPYWEPEMMKKRFERMADAKEADQIHDSLTYRAAEPELMRNYEKNVAHVTAQMEATAQRCKGLSGQWSVDVMQEGEDFWIIDMAPAENSALYGCVPIELRRPREENWLPGCDAFLLEG